MQRAPRSQRCSTQQRDWIEAQRRRQVPRLGLEPVARSESEAEARSRARELVSRAGAETEAAAGRRSLPADPDRRPADALGLVLAARDALVQLAARAGAVRGARLRRRARALPPARRRTTRGASGRSSSGTAPTGVAQRDWLARVRRRAARLQAASCGRRRLRSRRRARVEARERLTRIVREDAADAERRELEHSRRLVHRVDGGRESEPLAATPSARGVAAPVLEADRPAAARRGAAGPARTRRAAASAARAGAPRTWRSRPARSRRRPRRRRAARASARRRGSDGSGRASSARP